MWTYISVIIYSQLPFIGNTIRRTSSVAHSCLTLCDPMNCSTPGFPISHQLLELAQTHVHWVNDAIQPSHPLLSLYPTAFYHSLHQGLFQWVTSSHHLVKVLEVQHQSSQWIFRIDFLMINWLDLLAVQRTLNSLLQHHSSKTSVPQHSAFLIVCHIHLWLLEKP